jgi:hypothetical protein
LSPTQRSLRYLREAGYTATVVEYWNAFSRRKHDLWGFDILAYSPEGILFVQTTTLDHGATRLKKLQSLETTASLARQFRCEVHAWRKLAKTRKWEPKITKL